MIVKRQMAGLKGAVKGGMKGALWGAVLAPFNILALSCEKYKAAAGLTAAGAVVGAGIGGTLGYNSATKKFDFDEKMKTPEGREQLFQEAAAEVKEMAQEFKEETLKYVGEINPQDYCSRYTQFFEKHGSLEVPEQVLQYIKYYKKFATPRIIDQFYSDPLEHPEKLIDKNNMKMETIFIASFTSVFPTPVKPEDLKYYFDPLLGMTYLTNGGYGIDDDFITYWYYKNNTFENETTAGTFTTFSDAIKAHVQEFISDRSWERKSGSQIALCKTFLAGLK